MTHTRHCAHAQRTPAGKAFMTTENGKPVVYIYKPEETTLIEFRTPHVNFAATADIPHVCAHS